MTNADGVKTRRAEPVGTAATRSASTHGAEDRAMIQERVPSVRFDLPRIKLRVGHYKIQINTK